MKLIVKLNDGIIGEMLGWLVQLPSISKKGKMKRWERALLEGPQEVEMSPQMNCISHFDSTSQSHPQESKLCT